MLLKVWHMKVPMGKTATTTAVIIVIGITIIIIIMASNKLHYNELDFFLPSH